MISRAPVHLRQVGPGEWTGSWLPSQAPVTFVVTDWRDLAEERVDLAKSKFEPSFAAFIADFGRAVKHPILSP